MIGHGVDVACFESLRYLVSRVDLQVGVATRKLLLDGHEQLHLRSDLANWKDWLKSVVSRLETMADISEAERIWLRNEIVHDLVFACPDSSD